MELNSVWQHVKSGKKYTVVGVANENATEEKKKKFPITVIYKDEDGKLWSRPLHRWTGKFLLFIG